MKRLHAFSACAIVCTLLVASSVSAQPERQRIRDLNQQAMSAYAGLELETAKSLLQQALEMAQRAGLTTGRELAQTYMNLGVVAIGGFSDNAGGLGHFVNALTADPTITLDPNISTPDVQAMFAQARARAGRGTTAPPPTTPTPTPDAAATLVHTPPEEQLQSFPIPVFVQVPPQFRAVEVLLRYRSGGTGMFASLVMDRVSNGYGMEIPCAAIHSASVQYFIIARDAQQRVVARVGSETQPVNVRIVTRRTRPVLALPTRSPPESCAATPTPPPVTPRTQPQPQPQPQTEPQPQPQPETQPATTAPEAEEPALRSRGTGIVGDACAATEDCGENLVCDEALCTEPAQETESAPPRFFFHMGYSGGWIAVRPGMLADSSVPFDPRTKPEGWNDALNGPFAPPGYTEAEWQTVVALLYPSYVIPEDGVAPGAGDPRTNDSDCDVDPDRYCVRVTEEGIRPVGALRFEVGYWLIPRIGVSLDLRTGTHAGADKLARTLLALRAHVLLTKPRAVGSHIGVFVGGGIGQIQGRVPQGRYEGPDLTRASSGLVYLRSGTPIHRPWTVSGLGHIQLGALFGYRFTERLGIVVEPTMYIFFPNFAFATDTTVSVALTF